LRKGRFAGGGTKNWIALNDRTVARVKNKGHVIIRAKAGRITVNAAAQGTVLGQAAVDDRPGETVYLQYRLGDLEMYEVSAEEGIKFLRKSKRTAPIDETRPNNEEVHVLINLSRLGFDLMEPATGEVTPDDSHAVITFLRRNEAEKFEFGIWSEQGFVGALKANEAVSTRVSPGDHFYLAGHSGRSFLKLEAEAGKRYYAWLDYGAMIGRVRLTPIARNESDKLDKWTRDLTSIQLKEDAINERIRERAEIVTGFIENHGKKTATGEADFHLLSSEHAF
jgi:hypothetical protein